MRSGRYTAGRKRGRSRRHGQPGAEGVRGPRAARGAPRLVDAVSCWQRPGTDRRRLQASEASQRDKPPRTRRGVRSDGCCIAAGDSIRTESPRSECRHPREGRCLAGPVVPSKQRPKSGLGEIRSPSAHCVGQWEMRERGRREAASPIYRAAARTNFLGEQKQMSNVRGSKKRSGSWPQNRPVSLP